MSGIQKISLAEAEYPQRLREIHSPPKVLYVKGKMGPDKHSLAVVGTRKATRYGIEATEKFIKDLSRLAPVTIVSGLATGIDTIAHKAALKHGLRTIGILGSGMDQKNFFPPQNVKLADEIVASGGAVISEYPEGTPAMKHHFPERNRIVAGLSHGVLVVEARERSGALITARLALEENREVFAVPGSVFSLASAGPNELIRQGAHPVAAAENILTELGIAPRVPRERDEASLSDIEKDILALLSDEERGMRELREATHMNTSDILPVVSMLELKGLIKNFGNDTWGRA